MRIKPFKPTAERPPEATAFLASVERLDDGITFDPRMDISERHREAIVNYLTHLRQKGQLWGAFIKIASSYIRLFPERTADLHLDEDTFKWLTGGFEAIRLAARTDPFHWRGLSLRGSELVALFHDRRKELNLEDETWSGVKKENFDRYRESQKWGRVAETAVKLILLFPERRAELQLDEDVWDGMKRTLAESFDARLAADMVLLFPERRREIRLDDEVWKQSKRVFKEYDRNSDWGNFVELALSLTILAAQDARITPDGQILITPKKPALSSAPPPLPERARV